MIVMGIAAKSKSAKNFPVAGVGNGLHNRAAGIRIGAEKTGPVLPSARRLVREITM